MERREKEREVRSLGEGGKGTAKRGEIGQEERRRVKSEGEKDA